MCTQSSYAAGQGVGDVIGTIGSTTVDNLLDTAGLCYSDTAEEVCDGASEALAPCLASWSALWLRPVDQLLDEALSQYEGMPGLDTSETRIFMRANSLDQSVSRFYVQGIIHQMALHQYFWTAGWEGYDQGCYDRDLGIWQGTCVMQR